MHEPRICYRREVMRSLPHIYRLNFWWFFDHGTGNDYDIFCTEMHKWCVANFCEGNYEFEGDEVHIFHDRDALAFRLRWC